MVGTCGSLNAFPVDATMGRTRQPKHLWRFDAAAVKRRATIGIDFDHRTLDIRMKNNLAEKHQRLLSEIEGAFHQEVRTSKLVS